MRDQKRGTAILLTVVCALVLTSCRTPVKAPASPTIAAEPLIGLDATEWLLTSLDGNKPEAGSTISLEFVSDGYVQGGAGCNSYGAYYSSRGNAFDLTELNTTSFDCDVSDSVLQQENAYFDALERIVSYRATIDHLEFHDVEGKAILVFARNLPPILDPALRDTGWTLAFLRGEKPLEGSHITLNLGLEGFDGFTGCNRYGGEYEAADKGNLTIATVWQTEMECESSALTDQEQTYVEAVRTIASYRLIDDRLEMDNAAGETTLIFDPEHKSAMKPDDLLGTAWQLASLNGDSLVKGSTITLGFHNGYRASGHAGCNDYLTTYEASGDDLRFLFFAMIEAGCSWEEALIEQEGEYTTILGWASGYRLQEGWLEILTERGEVLTFEPLPADAASSLEGTEWMLSAFVEETDVESWDAPVPMPVKPLPETRITATFENGTVGGSAGCNSYGAPFTADGSALQVETPESTVIDCQEPSGIIEQERRYLDILTGVVAYHIHYNQLWLESGDGRALVFATRDCSIPNAFPTEESQLIWPTLRQVQPPDVAPGDLVEIRGTGGFLYWNNECGEFRNESARDFQLFFDGEPAGSITCYAHTCLAKLTLPADAMPGIHTISVEGGSSLELEVGRREHGQLAPGAICGIIWAGATG